MRSNKDGPGGEHQVAWESHLRWPRRAICGVPAGLREVGTLKVALDDIFGC